MALAQRPLARTRLAARNRHLGMRVCPHYFHQQQFLAHEMEKAQELGAQKVSVLHIAPGRNTDFQRITSPQLFETGKTATEKWKELVRHGDRFTSVTTEDFFGRFPIDSYPALHAWWTYVTQRYAWLA